MAGRGQLAFEWTRPTSPACAPPYPDLAAFVARVRAAGIARLRQLKRLVDAAVTEAEFVITDEDVPL